MYGIEDGIGPSQDNKNDPYQREWERKDCSCKMILYLIVFIKSSLLRNRIELNRIDLVKYSVPYRSTRIRMRIPTSIRSAAVTLLKIMPLYVS